MKPIDRKGFSAILGEARRSGKSLTESWELAYRWLLKRSCGERYLLAHVIVGPAPEIVRLPDVELRCDLIAGHGGPCHETTAPDGTRLAFGGPLAMESP